MNDTNSLSVIDGVSGMTSLEIAEVTGKQHKHVMRDIRALLKQGLQQSNFGLMFKISKLGHGAERKDPYYQLTPKGCLILASGYDALLREKIINRLEALEKNSKPQLPETYLDALKQLVSSEEQETAARPGAQTTGTTTRSERRTNHGTQHRSKRDAAEGFIR